MPNRTAPYPTFPPHFVGQALARFETSQNASWFCETKMFWYKRVFGTHRR
jgi:hypothetical protein